MSNLDCLTFDAEVKKDTAAKQIWVNRVRAKASEGNYLVGDYETDYTSAQVAGMTDNQVYELDIYGKNKGKLSPRTRGSEEWEPGAKCYELEKWYIIKPPDQFMGGVVDYTIEPFNPAWDPPDPEA